MSAIQKFTQRAARIWMIPDVYDSSVLVHAATLLKHHDVVGTLRGAMPDDLCVSCTNRHNYQVHPDVNALAMPCLPLASTSCLPLCKTELCTAASQTNPGQDQWKQLQQPPGSNVQMHTRACMFATTCCSGEHHCFKRWYLGNAANNPAPLRATPLICT